MPIKEAHHQKYTERMTPEMESANELRAREIAGKGNYERIERELQNSGLFEGEKRRVLRKYDRVFRTFSEVNDCDLEMFTILDLYHQDTAEHCAETYLLAKAKVEKKLASGVYFSKLFKQEFVSLDEFFRACLLHDIGKVEVPRFVTEHPMNEATMNDFLRDCVLSKQDPGVIARLEEAGGIPASITTAEELDAYLADLQLRPVHFVPARLVLSSSELEELESRGFDGNMSLMDIIKTHEAHSRSILEQAGMQVESELAGLHHNYEGIGSRYPVALGSLNVSVDIEALLHIVDLSQALSAKRGYKVGFSPPRVARIIMEEVAHGRIHPEAAYLWVHDDMHEYSLSTEGNVVSLEDARDLRFVQDQLQKIRMDIDSDSTREARWRMAA